MCERDSESNRRVTASSGITEGELEPGARGLEHPGEKFGYPANRPDPNTYSRAIGYLLGVSDKRRHYQYYNGTAIHVEYVILCRPKCWI
jgi:hypothetical protein